MNDKCLQLIDSYKKLIEYKGILDFYSKKLDKNDIKELKKIIIEIKNISNGIKEIFYQRNLGDLYSVVNTTSGKYHSMCVALISKYQKHNNDKDYDDVMENNIYEASELYPESLAFIGKTKIELGDMSGLQDLETAKKMAWEIFDELFKETTTVEFEESVEKIYLDVINVYKNFIDLDIDFSFDAKEFKNAPIRIYVIFYKIKKLIKDGKIKNAFDLIIILRDKKYIENYIKGNQKMFTEFQEVLFFLLSETLRVDDYDYYTNELNVENIVLSSFYDLKFMIDQIDYYSHQKDLEYINKNLDELKNKSEKAELLSMLSKKQFESKNDEYARNIKKAISLASVLRKEEKSDGLINVLSNQLYLNDFKQSQKIINLITDKYKKIEALSVLAKRKFDLNDNSWFDNINEAESITEELISQKNGCSGIDINKSYYSIFRFYLETKDYNKALDSLCRIINSFDFEELRGQATLEYIDAKIKSFE